MASTERAAEGEVDGIDNMGPALDFLRLLWQVEHSLQSSSKRTERGQPATGPQQLVMRIVGSRENTSAGELAEFLHLHPSTLSGILHRLDQRGMIARKGDPADARRSIVTLSAKGRKVITGRANAGDAAIRKVLARMPGKVDAARELLAAISEELDQLGR